jgi:hypothetical protein
MGWVLQEIKARNSIDVARLAYDFCCDAAFGGGVAIAACATLR